jgi:hypothetical protein
LSALLPIDIMFRCRTLVNNPTTYYRIMNAMRKEDGRDENERATDIVNDIHQLLERLHQTFTTANGTKVNVRGDFTKLCLMPDLNARQRTLLHSLEMTAKKIPGTQETRNIMCKYMTGYCVRYVARRNLRVGDTFWPQCSELQVRGAVHVHHFAQCLPLGPSLSPPSRSRSRPDIFTRRGLEELDLDGQAHTRHVPRRGRQGLFLRHFRASQGLGDAVVRGAAAHRVTRPVGMR